MSLTDQLQGDLKAAMKGRDAVRVSTLKLALAALRNRQIELRSPGAELNLPDSETVSVLRKEARHRQESIMAFQSGGREELAAREAAELAVLRNYLPAELSADQIRALVAEIVAGGISDYGAVMKAVMSRAAGQADGKLAAELVRQKLQ
ncbi:MAG: GatB/YqeY domain-containing protein [Candidatus Liptonbacteria bacterium]|nr:GatB/YqeY domain-containing protein [Candidatus Liptonbacteria bacterium]